MSDPDPQSESPDLEPGPGLDSEFPETAQGESASELDLEPGQRAPGRSRPLPKIPGYRIEKAIGRGATGIVFRARQLAVDRPVALKILHPELVGTKRAVRRLQREARTAARLAHPSIISAIDMGEQDGQWWYAMELVEGTPLSRRLREGPLSEREALRVFTPLCEALQHACEAGVVHRDIKPANILIDERGRARLVDLGLAFAEDDPMMTSGGGTLGTPHYISPEQARDPSTADTRSDIWSLGATLFHALCGRPPFEGDSVAEILSGVLYQRIPDPRRLRPGLSRGMVLVLRKCLNQDPARRYQEPQELLRDLERLRERRSVQVRASSLDPVEGQRSLIVLAGIAVAVGLLAVGATWIVVAPPWRDTGSAPQSLGGPRKFPRIEAALRNFEEGGDLARPTLAELEQLRVGLQPHEDVARQRIEAAQVLVLESLGRSLERMMSDYDTRQRALFAEQDFAGLERLLTTELRERLFTTTGFDSVEQLPTQLEGRISAWRTPLAQRTAELRRAALLSARACLRRHLGTRGLGLQAELDSLRSAGLWRDAQMLLRRRTAADWCREAGCIVDGLDPEQVLDPSRPVLEELMLELQTAWRELDRGLYLAIQLEADDMLARLERGELTGAGQVLRDEFGTRFAQVPLLDGQLPETGPEWPLTCTRALETQAVRLETRERELVAELAEGRLQELIVEADALCARREYARCERMWADEIDYWKRAMTSRGLEDSLAAMELRRREAILLRQVLVRAAEGVLARARASRTVDMRLQSLRVKGRIELVPGQPDPLLEGFVLLDVLNDARHRFGLQPSKGRELVEEEDVIELAGLNGVGLEDEEQLMKALFHYHEGSSFAEARRSLPVAINDALVADLRARIEASSQDERDQEQLLQGRIEQRLVRLRRDARAERPDHERLLEEVDGIRDTFSTSLADQQRKELDGLEELFRARLSEESRIEYLPTQRETFPLGRSRLSWTFTGTEAEGWSTGPWRSNLSALELERPLSESELMGAENALSHPLGLPLDLGREVSVTWTLERAGDSVPGNTLVLGVPGFWIYYQSGKDPRFWIDTRPVDEGLPRFDGGEGWPGQQLPRSGSFELTVRFDVVDGRCSLALDGQPLAAGRSVFSLRGAEASQGGQLSLRAARPLMVLGVQLEGRFEER